MKKLSILSVAFALVAGLSQCSKPNLPVFNGETQHVVLNASWDNGGSKIDQDGTLFKWTIRDILDVRQNGMSIGTLTCTDVANGTFEGYIMRTTGKITFTFQGASYRSDFMNQTGVLNDAVYLESGELDYKANGNYGTVSMTMPHAVLLLDLSELGTGTTVTITAGGNKVASVAGVNKNSTKVYVAVPESGAEKTYCFYCDVVTAGVKWSLEKNKFYTQGVTGAPTGDAIRITPAKFSASGSKTVNFSNGNLYYDGSSWNFEANQWDFRTYPGKGSRINGGYSDTGTPSKNWGLFGWSGDTNVNYGRSSSTDNAQYAGSFKNWGAAPGLPSAVTAWSTLSNAEWKYLLNISSATSYRANASNLRKALTLNVGSSTSKAYGLVILPDGTKNPSTVFSNIKSTSDLATYGAVFLPGTGYRTGTTIHYAGKFGNFWSRTNDGTTKAYSMDFNNGTDGTAATTGMATNTRDRYYGYAVRLVRTAQ